MIPVYVNDIKSSLKNNCYFSALSLALTLPDICGMAEYPNKTVCERYIEWYDKYLGAYMAHGKDDLGGNNPWLSGEVIYNLRNTYLHQGNPGIANDKVKEEANKFDEFVLMLGDGTALQSLTLNIEAGRQETGKITYRKIIVDVTYLCESISDYALWYYENNHEKFKFNFNVITQEEFMNPSAEEIQFAEGDDIAKILNRKLEKEGSPRRVVEEPGRNRRLLDKIHKDLDIIFSKSEMKQRFLTGKAIFTFTYPRQHSTVKLVEISNNATEGRLQEKTESKKENTNTKNKSKKKQLSKNVSGEKREAQVCSFFGRHFKEKLYLDKKEEIIRAVLESRSKQQVNNNLMKHFTSKEVKEIYQRLGPLIKGLPG